ncbi:transcriptional regulator, partial [Bifidobacterium adolescentis]
RCWSRARIRASACVGCPFRFFPSSDS